MGSHHSCITEKWKRRARLQVESTGQARVSTLGAFSGGYGDEEGENSPSPLLVWLRIEQPAFLCDL